MTQEEIEHEQLIRDIFSAQSSHPEPFTYIPSPQELHRIRRSSTFRALASDILSPLQMTQEEIEHEQLILKNIQSMQEEGMEYVDRLPGHEGGTS